MDGEKGRPGVSFNMAQKRWTLAFVLTFLKTQLYFFHGGMDGDGTQDSLPPKKI